MFLKVGLDSKSMRCPPLEGRVKTTAITYSALKICSKCSFIKYKLRSLANSCLD